MINFYINPFTSLLRLLNVKYTEKYSWKTYIEHPNRNNLLGLSQMLSTYNIMNEGLIVDDKKTFDLRTIKPPFVAQLTTGFAVVSKFSEDKITCILNESTMVIDEDTFRQSWKGVLLLVQPDKSSIEPQFSQHRKEELLQNAKIVILLGTAIALFVLALFTNKYYNQIGTFVLIALNLVGLFVCYLLLQKQLHINNRITNKLCSIFTEDGDCNTIIDTDASKVFGISWSEIGAGYFLANLVMIGFFPVLIPVLAIFNIMTLPYSLWSIWYQKYKARNWCTLCLIIQLIFWLILVANIIFGFFLPVSMRQILIVGTSYIFSIIFHNILYSLWSKSIKGNRWEYLFNSLKFSTEIFEALLRSQQHYNIDISDSSIIFGNPNAKVRITIFSNPHCNPCAEMHKKIIHLRDEFDDKINIQYIFCSFGPQWDDSTKYLIATYLNNNQQTAEKIYNEWFESGKTNKYIFMQKYSVNIDNQYVLSEFNKHVQWNQKNNIESTPTIFINGQSLPSIYNIEDLRYYLAELK